MRKRRLRSPKSQLVLKLLICEKSVVFCSILAMLCLFADVDNALAAKASIKVVQNGRLNGNLVMKLQAEEVFTEKAIKFLNRGFTVNIEYKIELWRSRRYWFDRLESQHNIIFQIEFEPLEKRYICLKSQQEMAITSKLDRQLDKIIQWTTQPEPLLNVISLARLDPKAAYYYNIEMVIATLTAKNVKDLQKWLGEFDGKEDEPSTFTKTSFKVAADFLSSRNNKKVSARSKKFHLHDLPKIDEQGDPQ